MAQPDNEFKDLTIPELRGVAAMFAVEVGKLTRKSDILAEIEKDGVTWDMYVSTLAPDPVEEDEVVYVEDEVPVAEPIVLDPAEVDPSLSPVVESESTPPAPVAVVEAADVLIRMTRPNFSYQIRGYKFTREHPFALVAEDDADYLIERDGGFRTATPREAREYYAG